MRVVDFSLLERLESHGKAGDFVRGKFEELWSQIIKIGYC